MDIPMLFATEMVEATYEGRKNNTRRLRNLEEINKNPDNWKFEGLEENVEVSDVYGKPDKNGLAKIKTIKGLIATFYKQEGEFEEYKYIKCPYGKKGDTIYVRETWANLGYNNCQNGREEYDHIVYKATKDGKLWEKEMAGWRWRPGIHLKKEDSRLWLEITDIGIERLQDISKEDAINEGIEFGIFDKQDQMSQFGAQLYKHYNPAFRWVSDPILSYCSLWEKINGIDSCLKNPWVWVIRYKVVIKDGLGKYGFLLPKDAGNFDTYKKVPPIEYQP